MCHRSVSKVQAMTGIWKFLRSRSFLLPGTAHKESIKLYIFDKAIYISTHVLRCVYIGIRMKLNNAKTTLEITFVL